MRTKNCTHCGEQTHTQPQDSDHDTGYGHCYNCLNKSNWYVKNTLELLPDYSLTFWASRPFNGSELTSDDSDPKVCEVVHDGKVIMHQTFHTTTDRLIERLRDHCSKLLVE